MMWDLRLVWLRPPIMFYIRMVGSPFVVVPPVTTSLSCPRGRAEVKRSNSGAAPHPRRDTILLLNFLLPSFTVRGCIQPLRHGLHTVMISLCDPRDRVRRLCTSRKPALISTDPLLYEACMRAYLLKKTRLCTSMPDRRVLQPTCIKTKQIRATALTSVTSSRAATATLHT